MHYVVFLLWLVYTYEVFGQNTTNTSTINKDNIFLLKKIKLTTKNSLILKGSVDDKSISTLIHQLNKMEKKNEIYLYLDTPGGSVESGEKLISEIINHNVNCIAERAYSMGFAILQSCKNRYIVRHGKLMIHQVQFGLGGELGKVSSYVDFVKQMEYEMTNAMALRIGLNIDAFKYKILDEWWLYGLFALQSNCADEMVQVECSKELTKQNYTITKGTHDYIYSKCPLVTNEVDKKKSKTPDKQSFFFDFI